MERWKYQWPIENEYDVQSILWLMLRPYFEDLHYEENLAKLGRSGHRYDFGIPSLNTIVEVKYVRKKEDFQKIVNEVGLNSAQLLPQTDFRNIVVFAYDNSRSVEQHSWTVKALRSITFVKHAIIVSAPSNCKGT